METLIESGFAISVAAFLLFRMERQLDELTKAITLLRHCQACRMSPWKTVLNDEVVDAYPQEEEDHDA